MGEGVGAVIQVAKWSLKITFIMACILAVLVIIGVITTYFVVVLNATLLGEIFGVVQIWLPFNLNIILIWMAVAGTAYLGYRLAMMAYNLLNSWLGR